MDWFDLLRTWIGLDSPLQQLQLVFELVSDPLHVETDLRLHDFLTRFVIRSCSDIEIRSVECHF